MISSIVTTPLADARGNHALPPYKLRRALDYIESHLADRIVVGDIAAAVGTSAFHFSRAFRKATGRPPYAYLLDRRVALAQRLLTEPILSLNEVAGQCGIGSTSQFSRLFRRATGVTPGAYRNRL